MRWAPDSRARLQRAAFELFAEQGYSATTVPQITARAGLTTRTFFRYFADKREVIFGGNEIPERAARLIAEAPADLEPMEVVRLVLDRVATEQFAGQGEQTAALRAIIHANDSLRDRDARKRDDLVRAARAAFIERGVPSLRAGVVAELGALLFHTALEEWATDHESRSMTVVLDQVMALLDAETHA
ncbi:MAG: TetR family transcriptional regulator [Herbiconiux sp.]|uniref:TetR family transcriptional regulator n=1 Tax=Herbiconiux sp. TaxID=1871186 RepID=UPI00120F67ED|nr:TetR family transcriptional regulator [Herbiconiux sp.]TAJ48305.1 MAG: TetR family transcriptional regulator [Herbiconiux sp.]